MPPQGPDAAFDAALEGDFRKLLAARPNLEPAAMVYADALLALASDVPPLSVRRALDEHAESALGLIVLRAWLDGDTKTIDEAIAAQRELGVEPDIVAISLRWTALAQGEALSQPDLPSRLAKKRAGAPTIEATVQAALEAIEQGEIAQAVSVARRATRMARAEGLMLMEYLSSLVLARARRHAGNPHLSLRILGALAEVAPQPWQAWIRYERRLAGESFEPDTSDWAATRTFDACIKAAEEGEAPPSLQELVALAPMAKELSVLAEALDPGAEVHAWLASWAYGDDHRGPGAIAGIAVPEIDDKGHERASAFVLTGPGVERRRVLRAGAYRQRVHVLDQPYALSQTRTFTALALLAMAGEQGEDERILFKQTYGFEARNERDMSSMRMLLHRVRQVVPEGGEVIREGGRARLVAPSPLAVPDPRCTLSLEARVLRFMGRHSEGVSAKKTAEALKMSVRSVQNILRQLLDEGACESVRSGREVGYKVEDTTFFKPTLDRLKPTGLP